MSLKNESNENGITLTKYVSDLRLFMFWIYVLNFEIVHYKICDTHSNITKKCRLRLQQKFEILSYTNPDELLNERPEFVSKCRHMNKFIFTDCNVKA